MKQEVPQTYYNLTDDVRIQSIGLSTFSLTEGESVYYCMDTALDVGYRVIDTSPLYGNEKEIGEALIDLMPKYSLIRSDFVIFTKLNPSLMGNRYAVDCLKETLANLRLSYVDVYLVHYPKPSYYDNNDPRNKDMRKKVWREMEEAQALGLTRSIGVCNYEIKHLEELLTYAKVRPVVNQCEFHPHLTRSTLVSYCRANGIHFQAFATLARFHPLLMKVRLLANLAEKYETEVPGILLAFALCQGISVLPKSGSCARIRKNYEALLIHMSPEDVKALSSLDRGVHYTRFTPWEVV